MDAVVDDKLWADLPREALLQLVATLARRVDDPSQVASAAAAAAAAAAGGNNVAANTSGGKEGKAKAKDKAKAKEKKAKEFDITRYLNRQVALQVQYEGGPYYGFASQAGECEETVEKHLFDALLKVRLIGDRQSSNYSRCGRTDRGVSALRQVVSLKLRSAFPLNTPLEQLPKHANDFLYIDAAKRIYSPEEVTAQQVRELQLKELREIDYPTLLNRCLPETIRVLGWCEVTPEFSSRFSATYRAYRYFFVKKNLDTDAMNRAAAYLIGAHDFRNLCKMDVAHVSNFVREIFSAGVRPFFASSAEDPAEAIWMLEIKGVAFLWHMVRCIMAVLFLVGEGKESPEIFQELFNVEAMPAKPHYLMADELPLVLHDCGFDELEIQRSPRVLYELETHYRGLCDRHAIAFARARNALEAVRAAEIRACDAEEFLHRYNSGLSMQEYSQLDGSARSRLPVVASSEVNSDSEQDKKRVKLSKDDSPSSVTWGQLAATLGPDPRQAHVPLLERGRGETYDERCAKIGGVRKERLERHLELQRTEGTKDDEFFAKMRKEGTRR